MCVHLIQLKICKMPFLIISDNEKNNFPNNPTFFFYLNIQSFSPNLNKNDKNTYGQIMVQLFI